MNGPDEAGRRRRRRRWTVAPLALLGLLVGVLSACDFDGIYDLPLPGSPVDADHAIEVTADFDNVEGVVPRTPVKVDDVTVGEVTEVERDGWDARLTLRVRDDVDLPDNAVAQIKQTSLLGEKFVSLDPPQDGVEQGRLQDGDHLELDETSRSPEVEEVLGALSMVLNGGGIAQLNTISQELNNLMDGRADELRSVLTHLESFIGTLDTQKTDIVRALEALNRLTATLNAEKRTITDALDVVGPTVATLDAQHAQLIGMLRSLDRLGQVGTRVIEDSKEDVLASLDELRPILRRLNEAGDALVPGLSLIVSFPFPKSAAEIIQGDYADTVAIFDIKLDRLYPPGSPIPDIVPDPAQAIGDVNACLRSGSLTSPPCQKVLGDVFLLDRLRAECQKDINRTKPVCRALAGVPVPPLGSGSGGPDSPGLPLLPTVPGGIGLRELAGADLPTAMSTMYSNGTLVDEPSGTQFYGGAR